jgi:hypothetical protein
MQSVILPVSEVELVVDGFRQAGDWSRRLGVPAHVTLAGPWPLEFELPVPALAAIAVAMRGTVFRLSRVDLLGDAICLLADDDAPLLKLRAGHGCQSTAKPPRCGSHGSSRPIASTSSRCDGWRAVVCATTSSMERIGVAQSHAVLRVRPVT